MAQEPSSRELLEAVKQQESGGRRYKADGKTLLEGPQTKYGTAKGEMQVLDMTNKDPGFGVKPARDDSPDERARVGRDYLNAMVKRYGSKETALVAYNWGPGNTDKWLKAGADPAKLPKETRNYVAKVTGSLGSTKLAQATPKAAPAKAFNPAGLNAVTAFNPTQNPMFAQLGPSYQAAFAVSLLADEGEKEGKDEDAPSESEKMLAAMPSKPAVVDLDLSYQSPFPEVQAQPAPVTGKQVSFLRPFPIKRAKGSPETGEVGYFQDPMGAPSAPITEDTFAKGKDFRAADALKLAKEFGTALGSNTESLVRGAVAQIPGAVGDLESLARMGINFSFGPGGVKVEEKTIAPTSEEIRARVPRITATRPESSGMESMGEMMAPGLGKAAVPVAKAAAKGTAKEMLRGIEGQGVLAPISPQDSIMYAVKPRGGTFLTSGSIDKPAISKIDKTIEDWFQRTAQDAPDAETTKIIRDFLDKKGRKYLTNELGTGADPIRKAMASGEIQPVGSDVARFPEYLLHSARTSDAPGHSVAKKDLENLYDRASAVEGRVVGMHDPADADARSRFNNFVLQSETNARATMAQEGLPQELQNPSIRGITGNELDASYYAGLRNAIGDPQEFPAIAGAVQRGQPIYDLGYQGTYMDMFSPKYVAENINAIIPAKKLKNMSFDDAMIEGSKLMEVSRNYDKAVELMAKGANVPKEVLFQYTKPVIAADNGQWVQITDKLATKMEGKMLHHSVGNYATSDTYGHGGKKGFDTGVANVFSLRDPKTGLAKTTLAAKKLDDGSLMFTEHKSNFNSFPEKDVKDIFTLFDKLGKNKPVSFLYGYVERYPNDPTGTPLPRAIEFNWRKAYQEWKDTGKLPPIPSAFGDTLPPPPSQINIPFAKGGMVERQVSTARYI